jgi:hypothetical protein
MGYVEILMAKASPIWTAFNGGEASPQMDGRVDLPKYGTLLYKSSNFIPTVPGSAYHRPGTQYMGTAAAVDDVWLVEFVFNTSIAYILEFSPGLIRFWNTSGQILDGGLPYEVVTPYTASDLTLSDGTFGLSYAQSGDILYLACAGHPPSKLMRFGETDWVFAVIENMGGPWLPGNRDKAVKMWGSAREGIIDLECNSEVFTADMVGTLVRLEVEDLSPIKPWEAGQRKDTAAAWLGERRRSDSKTYICTDATAGSAPSGGVTLKYVRTGGNKPVHVEGQEWDGAQDTAIITGTDYLSTGVKWEYEDSGSGIVRILSYVNSKKVTALVLERLPLSVSVGLGTPTNSWAFVGDGSTQTFSIVGAISTHVGDYLVKVNSKVLKTYQYTIDATADTITILSRDLFTGNFLAVISGVSIQVTEAAAPSSTHGSTYRWEIGAWSADNEYPQFVCFFRERLCFGGKRTFWASVSGDFENFADREFGEVLPDSAISIPIFGDQANNITWMRPSSELQIGTTGGIVTISENNTTEALGPANTKVEFQTSEGASRIKPPLIGGSTLYWTRDGRHVLEFKYDFGTDSYDAEDMSVLSGHVLKARVTHVAFASSPDSVAWQCIPGAEHGYRLIGLTFNKKQEVTAYHPHAIGGEGTPKSVGVMPNANGQDEVWFAMKRTINGAEVCYIERFALPPVTGNDPTKEYPDCHIVYSGAATAAITGVSHLNGETAQIMAPLWCAHPDVPVVAGTVPLDLEVDYAVVGLYAPAVIAPMRIEAGAQDGTAMGKLQRISTIVARLYNTVGGYFGPSEAIQDPFVYRTPSDDMGVSTGLFTGDTEPLIWQGGSARDSRVFITQPQPLPMTVVALMPQVATEDRG